MSSVGHVAKKQKHILVAAAKHTRGTKDTWDVLFYLGGEHFETYGCPKPQLAVYHFEQESNCFLVDKQIKFEVCLMHLCTMCKVSGHVRSQQATVVWV